MKCKTIHKNLIFFLEGDLPENKTGQIQAHLSGCKNCAAFAEDMKKTLGIIEKEKSVKTNPFFYTRLKARLESQAKPEKIPFWKPALVKVVQPVFFSVLLIAGIYTGFKVGTPVRVNTVSANYTTEELIPYLNEMRSEPIEKFLME
jgi:predicted anti-sigma-YlaC factor YlaD